MCLYLSLGIDLQLTGLNLTDFVILLQTAIPHVTSSHCVPTTLERLSGCGRLSGSRSGPRSADHILRELLGAPHLAAHEGRKTAADDRAHRDEGNAALHEPRKPKKSRNGANWSVCVAPQHEDRAFPRQGAAQSFMVFQHPPTPHSVLSEYGLPGCCKCNFDFGPNHPLLLGRGHHAHDTRAREEEQECKTAARAEDVAHNADEHAEDDRHRHLCSTNDPNP